MQRVTAIIVAGGKGRRMGAGENKVYLKLLGREMLLYTIDAFEKNKIISDMVVVTDDIDRCSTLLDEQNYKKRITVVKGGATRQKSVYNGICAAEGEIVVIHDGARALITDAEITAVTDDCIEYGAAALGVKCKDTLKKADKAGFISDTVDREYTYMIQTPQVFDKELISTAHVSAVKDGVDLTDDCALLERLGKRIKITQGSYENIKLTTPEDILIAEKIIRKRAEK